MSEKSFFDTAKRFWREATGEKVFSYDPNLQENWKTNPDGSVTVGKHQVETAIASAQAFKDRGPEIAESTATVIGLSLTYIKEHFPEALKDVGYRE